LGVSGGGVVRISHGARAVDDSRRCETQSEDSDRTGVGWRLPLRVTPADSASAPASATSAAGGSPLDLSLLPDLFSFTMNPLELVVRGSIMYLGLILVMRFILRRDVGSMNMADLLFIVLVADASQNAMAGEYRTVSDGFVLVGSLVMWNVVLDWLSYHSSAVRQWLTPRPLPLIEHGKWVRANLKREWISTEEVHAKLRESGIEDITQVKRAVLESSGELSVIRR
jgi:hypothetical protein